MMNKYNNDINKNEFLKRKFLYDLQCVPSFVTSVFIWYFSGLWMCRYGLKLIFDDKQLISDIGDSFFVSVIFLLFGFYNLFTYIWSKKMSEKYGIELFGDLDQEWLKREQGYDSKIFGEIYAKNLHFRKLGAKSLMVTVPLSFLPWPAVPLIVGIMMIVVYFVYRNVYFNNAMADRWPRVYGSGIVISRILDQDKSDIKNKEGK